MEENQSLFSLSIDPVTKSHLSEVAKWARFLAIAGMVLLALALVFAFLTVTVFAGNQNMVFTINGRETEELTTAMKVGYVIGMIIVLAVAFFPLLFLLQFANRLKTALAASQQEALNTAFQNLKKYFRYLGIILIIVLCLYGLMFALALFGKAAS